MSDSYVRGEPATEVLDLYDVLPERADAKREPERPTEDDPMTSMIKGTGRNLAVIIGMFSVSLAAFIVCTTLFSLGVGLLCWSSACSSWSAASLWPAGRRG